MYIFFLCLFLYIYFFFFGEGQRISWRIQLLPPPPPKLRHWLRMRRLSQWELSQWEGFDPPQELSILFMHTYTTPKLILVLAMQPYSAYVSIQPFLPTVSTFALRETDVSRTANVGTVGKNWLWKRNGGKKWVKP